LRTSLDGFQAWGAEIVSKYYAATVLSRSHDFSRFRDPGTVNLHRRNVGDSPNSLKTGGFGAFPDAVWRIRCTIRAVMDRLPKRMHLRMSVLRGVLGSDFPKWAD
jgi:hypothetical protein